MLPMSFPLASMWRMTLLMQVLLTGERMIPTCFAINVICPPTKHLKAKHVRIKWPPTSSTSISIVISLMLARVKTIGSISKALKAALPLLADSRATTTKAELLGHEAY